MEVQASTSWQWCQEYWQWQQLAEVLAMLEVLAKAEVMEIQAPSNDDVGAQCAQPVLKMDVLAPMTVMEL